MDSVKLKDVDQSTIDLISGYIRPLQKMLKDRIVPKEVIDLCIIYYFIAEFFQNVGNIWKYQQNIQKMIA